jgi:hypothetical protein
LTQSNCRTCDKPNIIAIHQFKSTPYGDSYADSKITATRLNCNPLILGRCQNCHLLQLLHTTDLDSQYREYLYFTRVTHKLKEFYENISSNLSNKLALSQVDFVLDLGSNDGTFLSCFKHDNSRLLGVDPSRPACEEALSAGIEVLNDYFDSDLASFIKEKHGAPKLITCNYTIANVPDLNDFFAGLKILTSLETQVNIITGYHIDQFQVGMFDYIGHDHLTYLTLQDFQKLCESHGLKVNYARRHEHKGGSLEVGIVHANSKIPIQDSVSQLIQRESWLNSAGNSSINLMLNKIEQNRNFVISLLSSLKASGVAIFGVGASISTTSLLYNFEIGKYFDYLFDDDPRKIGRFSPGFGIEVDSLDNLEPNHLSIAVILAWQHTEKIIFRLRELQYTGLVLIPMPEIKLFRLSY